MGPLMRGVPSGSPGERSVLSGSLGYSSVPSGSVAGGVLSRFHSQQRIPADPEVGSSGLATHRLVVPCGLCLRHCPGLSSLLLLAHVVFADVCVRK